MSSQIKRQQGDTPFNVERGHWLLTCLTSHPSVFKAEYFKQENRKVFSHEAAGGSQRVGPVPPGSWSPVRHEQHPCAAGVSVKAAVATL